MILHWAQLVLHYGPELDVHRPKFEAAGQTTYGLLCCRAAPAGDRLSYSSGEHAEERLLGSEMWRAQIPAALENWTELDTPIVVAMVINRSPCRPCATLLATALDALHARFPLRAQQNRFLLASRGVYEDARMVDYTRRSDLVRLRDAGWELCVLQVGAELPDRGQILLEGIEGVAGRGFVRLG
jgi:hypothetical protein